MHPEIQQYSPSGFSLPVVIFILVVISVLAGAMARLVGGGAQSIAFEVQSTRAHLAARSGLEWAANATLGNSTAHYTNPTPEFNECPNSILNDDEGGYPTTLDFSSQTTPFPGLQDCLAEIRCQKISPDDLQRRDGFCNDDANTGNCTVSLFLLSSNATCGTVPAQAQRNLQWLVGKETSDN
ncbi:hypothetical protein [Desulfonatronum parangueonense]